MPKKIKHSEDAYIALTDLARVRILKNVLNELNAGINESIPKAEVDEVLKTFREWERRIEHRTL